MARIKSPPTKIIVTATIEFTEDELEALNALTCYGTENFLKVFYEKLGKCYLEPHEAGLVSVFNTIRGEIPPILQRAHEARKELAKLEGKYRTTR